MNHARRLRKNLFTLAVAVAVALEVACPGTTGAGPRLRPTPVLGTPPVAVGEEGKIKAPAPWGFTVHEERTIAVPLGADMKAELGALIVRPREGKGPFILVVPGGSDVSRNGTRTGDGTGLYPVPVDVSLAWADAFAARGAHVLLWDKRTCGPNDDPVCKKNPQDDVDALGPAALAKDVDAACALARAEPGYDGRLVLFAHGQAAQVALSSSCAHAAVAVVLLAPIPRAIDEVIIAGLKDRTTDVEEQALLEGDPAAKQALRDQANQLKNLAGTREAEFASIKANRFAATARVSGATLAFWKGWLDVTARTATLIATVHPPKIVVLGGDDRQYGEEDRGRIRVLAPNAFLEVAGADHHLLTHGALAKETIDVVGAAIDRVLAAPQT
jgi:alpha-beta hydrolase superfamily lysophospholipase